MDSMTSLYDCDNIIRSYTEHDKEKQIAFENHSVNGPLLSLVVTPRPVKHDTWVISTNPLSIPTNCSCTHIATCYLFSELVPFVRLAHVGRLARHRRGELLVPGHLGQGPLELLRLLPEVSVLPFCNDTQSRLRSQKRLKGGLKDYQFHNITTR